MSITALVRTIGTVLLTVAWASVSFASPLLPSQEQPNFFNVRICRDRQVLAALKTGAARTLKTDVSIASGKGQNWNGYHPDDIRLEAVSISPDDRNAVFCSVTISAKGITERIVYSVSETLDAWVVRFGGDLSTATGGHKLFPEGPITVEPRDASKPP